MADEKKDTRKIVLEREYVVPLRREWLKVSVYKRATKASKALKEFIAKHMKIYDRDTRKVKVDIYLNNEIRFRGMKKPLAKVKVKAIKYDDGTVVVKLVQLPKHIEFEIARNVRRQAESMKKMAEAEKSSEAKPQVEAKKEETAEDKKDNAEAKRDIKEKEESSKLAMQETEKAKAKEAKHTNTPKLPTKREPELQRKMLKR